MRILLLRLTMLANSYCSSFSGVAINISVPPDNKLIEVILEELHHVFSLQIKSKLMN